VDHRESWANDHKTHIERSLIGSLFRFIQNENKEKNPKICIWKKRKKYGKRRDFPSDR
jgi:hypothetical protein